MYSALLYIGIITKYVINLIIMSFENHKSFATLNGSVTKIVSHLDSYDTPYVSLRNIYVSPQLIKAGSRKNQHSRKIC